MKCFKFVMLFSIITTTQISFAQSSAAESETCISIDEDIKHIESLIALEELHSDDREAITAVTGRELPTIKTLDRDTERELFGHLNRLRIRYTYTCEPTKDDNPNSSSTRDLD